MFFSKKKIEQHLREVESKIDTSESAKDMEALTEQYLEKVNGGKRWGGGAWGRWTRSF